MANQDGNRKVRILFVCSSNTCCSVMAQSMMQTMVDSIGLSGRFLIDSAACGKIRQNAAVDEQAREKLHAMNIPVIEHKPRQMTWGDYDKYDYLIGMDEWNIDDMRYITGSDPDRKICKLSSFAGADKDIGDPWYTNDYDTAYQDIQEGLMGLLNKLT